MGGYRAIRQMTALAQAKGANVRGGGVVNRSRKTREQQSKEVTDSLCGLF